MIAMLWINLRLKKKNKYKIKHNHMIKALQQDRKGGRVSSDEALEIGPRRLEALQIRRSGD